MTDDTSVPTDGQPSGGDQFGMPRRDIFEDPTIPSAVKLVYTALTMCADYQTRVCWPGRDRLARASSQSVRTVATAIRVGEKIGLWTVTRTQGSNRYVLHDRINDPARYVIGSGPLTPAGNDCTVAGQRLPAEDAAVAHEQDHRKRPSTKRSTSGDAFAAGVRSASEPDDRLIITDCREWRNIDRYDTGQAARYCIGAYYATLKRVGMVVGDTARDQMAGVLKDCPNKDDIRSTVQFWLDAAGTDEPNGGHLAWWPERKAS